MLTINLLSPPRPRRRAKDLLLGAGAVALIVLVGLAGCSYVLVTHVNQLRRDLATATQGVQALTRDIERLRARRALLQQLLATQMPASSVLETVQSVIPEDVWLTSVTARASDVAFEGYTFSYPSVARFMVELEDSGSVRNINLSTFQRETIADRDVLKFRITGDLIATHPVASKKEATP